MNNTTVQILIAAFAFLLAVANFLYTYFRIKRKDDEQNFEKLQGLISNQLDLIRSVDKMVYKCKNFKEILEKLKAIPEVRNNLDNFLNDNNSLIDGLIKLKNMLEIDNKKNLNMKIKLDTISLLKAIGETNSTKQHFSDTIELFKRMIHHYNSKLIEGHL